MFIKYNDSTWRLSIQVIKLIHGLDSKHVIETFHMLLDLILAKIWAYVDFLNLSALAFFYLIAYVPGLSTYSSEVDWWTPRRDMRTVTPENAIILKNSKPGMR